MVERDDAVVRADTAATDLMVTDVAAPPAAAPRASALGEHVIAILDAIVDGVAVQDASGRLAHANAVAARQFGFVSTDALCAATDEIVATHADVRDEHGAPLAFTQVLGHRGADELLVHLRVVATGDERWLRVRAQPVPTAGGDGWVVITLRDVTAKKAAQQESAEHQRRLELALAAGHMGVFEWKITEDRVVWSPDVERMHGIPVGSFDGSFEAYQRDIHPDDRHHVLSTTQQTLAGDGAHYLSYRIIRPDGEVRWLEAHGRLVRDDDGRAQRLVGVCRDVTEQREAEHTRLRAEASEAASREAERARARLAAILDSITDPFSVLDRELRLVHVNDSAARLLGRSVDELLGNRILDVIPTAKTTAFYRAYEKVLATRRPVTIEEHVTPWDRWYESSIYPLDDGLAVYSRDVTMRRQAMELTTRLARHSALRAEVSVSLAEARQTTTILQHVCEAVVDHLNAAFARIWTVDDAGATLVLQASAGMYTHTDGAHGRVPVGKFKIGRIASTRRPHLTNDVQHDPQVGDRAWATREGLVAFAGYPLVVDGRLVGVLAMFAKERLAEDTLTVLASIADLVAQGLERRRAELELQHKMEELARSNAELEQFAYVASHDLQEPLRMVASYNQLLARRYKGKLGEDADEFIGFTVEGVTRMQRLINDLLAYSRVGTRGREHADVDLEEVLAMTVANLERAIADEAALITHDPLPHVLGDEGQLIQLLQNLIGNAIKFHGDEPPRVHVGVRGDATGFTFFVRDNGIGIDPQYFERIFVIFQRLNPREQYPGTGIGLAICKKIVERHGGRIWVESEPGTGTTVLFTIPRNQRSPA